jgi:hypothetical protein
MVAGSTHDKVIADQREMRSRKISVAFAAPALWFLCVAIICIAAYLHPGLHSVSSIYREAGAAWIRQDQIYSTGESAFLYSPLIAAFYSPLALVSQNLSEALWRLLLGVALPLSLWLNARKLFGFSNNEFAYLLLLVLPLTLGNLHNGQANLIVLVLFLIASASALQSRWWACAFSASLTVYWKIYPVVFVLLLTVLFPTKLTARMFLALLGLFVVSLILQKPSYVLGEYANWVSHLVSDHRRATEYYGRWRDFYLLLRLIGIPISAMWWKVVEVITALIAVAICVFGKMWRWPAVTLVFGALSLAVVWILLFGPATEAATYTLIAVPCAYLLILGWCDASEASEMAPRRTATVAYLGFVAGDIINSWFHIKLDVYLIHAIQPCFAICFAVALFLWWKGQISEAIQRIA